MRKHLSEILLTLLTVALLVGFAFAVPHPAITDAAMDSYINDDSTMDDDYDFLFE
ncbi:MAG: hypothetical protein KHW80_09990 [Faecalibacterium sp.]|jgi:hypothetical protein|nr:hypothetical protein [Faecalibacterium sp.]